MKPRLEHQFLPAVLEIQETPPSPLGRIVIWVIVTFFVIALTWACFGQIDIVAVATGKTIPNGHVKVIQPLEIGTVQRIYVSDGQAVQKGDRLIDLDTSAVNAEIAQLASEKLFGKQKIKRLRWMAEQYSHGKTMGTPQDPVLMSQWLEYQDRLKTLQSEKNKFQAEYLANKQQTEKLAAILPIITRRSANEKKLVDKHLFPEQEYLQTEQQRLTVLYDLKSQQSRGQQLKEALAEIAAKISHTRNEFAKNNLEKREEAEHEIVKIEQELIKARARLKTHHLIAPISGIVQQLSVHTIGGIVTPAQALMVIVPEIARLEIEAYVENKDIGFVKKGQTVAIKLDAFPFTKYGTLEGEIVDLSEDAIKDETKGLIYRARVSLKQTFIQVGTKKVKLGSGMMASCEIKTGKRRVIEFFLAPLLKYASESIRER